MSDEVDSPPPLQDFPEESNKDSKDQDKSKSSSYYFFKSTPAEEAAKFAPKPITENPPANTNNNQPQASGLSAWNSAGTWEEKDMSSWAQNFIKQKFENSKFTKDGHTVSYESVKVEGDSSIVFTRGKKRPGYDLHISGEWKSGDSEGSFSVSEFETGNEIDELVIKFSNKKGPDNVYKFIRSTSHTANIRSLLSQFVKELQAQC